MKYMRWVSVLLVVALVSSVLAGCQKAAAPTPATTGKPTGEPIKIGGIGPLSPPGTPALGEEMMNAMKLRIDEINAAGGLLGRPVELVFEDSSGAPEKGTSAMEALINKHKVVAITGEGHSSGFLAEMEVAKRNNIVLLDCEAWSDQIRLRHYEYVFAMPAGNTMFNQKIADFVQGTGFKRPFILAEDTDFGVEGVQLLGASLKSMNIEFGSLIVDRTTKDFVPFLLQAKEFKPDILVVNVTGIGSYLIVQQAKELGLAPSADCAYFSGVADMGYPELWDTTGAAAVGVVWETAIHPKAEFTELTTPFVEKYTKTYNRPPTYAGLQAYDCILALEAAIKLAGSTDSAKIRDAMEKIRIKGTRGEIYFPTEAGVLYHQAPVPLLFLQYTENKQLPDKCEIVWPKDMQTKAYTKPQ